MEEVLSFKKTTSLRRTTVASVMAGFLLLSGVQNISAQTAVASNSGPICTGGTVMLYETGGDAESWEWSSSGNAVFNDRTLQNPTAAGAVNGEVFTVLITYDDDDDDATATTVVTVYTAVPVRPGQITSDAAYCANTVGAVFSISEVLNATEYLWNVPTGVEITSGQRTVSITVTIGSSAPATGTIRVYAINACGTGPARSKDLLVNQLPVAAGPIYGPETFSPGTSGIIYSVEPITEATSYIWSFSGSGVTINGTGGNVTLDFSTEATAGTLSVFGKNDCGDGSPSPLYISQDTKTLNLTLFLEGMYNGANGLVKAQDCEDGENSFNLFPNDVADTLTVELVQATSPYTTVFRQHGVPINTDGTISLATIPAGLTGNHHIVIKHRNHIETWSKSISFEGTYVSYNFTDAIDKAWGDNMVQVGSIYCIYTGDTDRNQYVELADLYIPFNLYKQFSFGYQASDINADGFVDLNDLYGVFNNYKKGVGMNTPLAPL